jgi:hypothetical protein
MAYPGDGRDRRVRSLGRLLLLTTAEGMLAVGSIFLTRSAERNALVLSYSLPRFVVGLGFLALTMAFAFASVRAYSDRVSLRRVVGFLDAAAASGDGRLIYSALGGFLVLLVGTYVLVLFRGKFVPDPPVSIQAAADRFFLGAFWLLVIPVQLYALLMSWYAGPLRDALSHGRSLGGWSALIIVLTLSSIQWVTLALRADWLYLIPGWFWHYHPKRLVPSDFYFILMIAAALSIAWAITRQATRHVRNVALCWGLVFLLQVGFGFAEGGGIESLRLKYVHTPLSDETRLACEFEGGVIESVLSYEVSHSGGFWLGTKPPGLFAFYVGMRDLVGFVRPEVVASSDACVDIVTRVAALAMPIVAGLVVVPMYVIERLLSPSDGIHASGLLYASVPSVLLMPLVPDQFLFPLLFMLSVMLLAIALVNRSFVGGILAGVSVYLCTFVSFSLLPVLSVGFLWFLVEGLRGVRRRRGRLKVPAIGVGLGVLAAWMALALGAGYNPAVRVVAALASHRQNIQVSATPGNAIAYVAVNSVEFGVWSGFALTALAAIGVVGEAKGGGRNGRTKAGLATAYGASVLGLLASGYAKGEVGRLWMFLVPLACVFAAPVASQLLGDRSRSLAMVVVLQLITACLMFLQMDFR